MRLPLSYLLVFTSEHCLSFSTRHGRSNAIAVPDLDYVETGDYDDEEYDDPADVYYDDEYSDKIILDTRAACRETWITEQFTIDGFWYKCKLRMVYNSRNVNHRG